METAAPTRGRPRPALAPAQRALWHLHRLEPTSARYHVPVVIRIDGPLDAAALERALTRAVARHEPLRTVVALDGERPVHRILAPPASVLTLVDLTDRPTDVRDAEGDHLIARWSAEPFDLAQAPPLRAHLIRLGPAAHVLGLFLHHIVCDGLSLRVLLDEIEEGYRGDAPRAPLPVRYTDWADEAAAQEPDGGLLAWWGETLRGAPTTLLPPEFPARPGSAHGHRVLLPAAALDSARALARGARTTPFVVVLAVYAAVLGRLAGSPDLIVGVPSSDRPGPDLEAAVGLFVTTVPVRIAVGDDLPLCRLVARTRDALREALEHRVPFETLIERLRPPRRPGTTPLVPVAFSADPAPLDPPRLGTATTRMLPFPAQPPKFAVDTTLAALPDGSGRQELVVNHAKALTPAAARWLATSVVEALVPTGAQPIRPSLAGLGPGDRPRLAGRLDEPDRNTAAPPARLDHRPEETPRSGWEQRIAGVWREVLAAPEVGVHENFFDLGGTSRALTRVHRALVDEVAGELPLVTLYEYPTIAELAGHLAGTSGSDPVGSGVPGPAGAPAPGRDRLTRLRRRRR